MDTDSKKSKFGVLNFGSKNGTSPPAPPPPPVPPIIVPIVNDTSSSEHITNIVMHAVHTVELEIVGNHDTARQNGSFLTHALLYIENELFDTPIAV